MDLTACDDRRHSKFSSTYLISQLPLEIKELILERLSTRDAARTALLSSQWRDVWLCHGCLVFDHDFFNKTSRDALKRAKAVLKIIDYILRQRTGPVRKFTLYIHDVHPEDLDMFQNYLDWWFRFLLRNGIEELTICSRFNKFQLPICIFSSRTLKKLKLVGFRFTSPSNTPQILPNLTELTLEHVHYDPTDAEGTLVFDIPNLETLSLGNCTMTTRFGFKCPKLVTHITGGHQLSDNRWRWFSHYCTMIRNLRLKLHEGFSMKNVKLPDSETNLQKIKLHCFCFENMKHLNFLMLLLRISPQLRELHIRANEWSLEDEDTVRMLEHPNFIYEDLMKTLNTLKIEIFCGTRAVMLFVKAILFTSSALIQVIHKGSWSRVPYSNALITAEELMSFPHASQNLQVVFEENMH